MDKNLSAASEEATAVEKQNEDFFLVPFIETYKSAIHHTASLDNAADVMASVETIYLCAMLNLVRTQQLEKVEAVIRITEVVRSAFSEVLAAYLHEVRLLDHNNEPMPETVLKI